MDYIYVVGGRNRGKTVSVVERYSVVERRWERCASMETSRGSHGVGLLGGLVCAVAGGGINSNLASCEVYEDQTNTWRGIADLAMPRHALSSASDGDVLYAVGGWVNGNHCSGTTERYDAATAQWVTCASLKVPRRLHGTAMLGGILYAFGGIDDNERVPIRDAERYDPQADEWTPIAPLPTFGDSKAGGFVSCCAVGDSVYVLIWGRKLLRYSPVTDSYTVLSALPLKEWFGFAVAALHDDIYVVGGSSEGAWTGAMHVYHTASGEWEELPRMKIVRRRCGAVGCTHPATACPPSIARGPAPHADVASPPAPSGEEAQAQANGDGPTRPTAPTCEGLFTWWRWCLNLK
eukprot:jgi/Tetstr1/456274/TSEL_043032.t1